MQFGHSERPAASAHRECGAVPCPPTGMLAFRIRQILTSIICFRIMWGIILFWSIFRFADAQRSSDFSFYNRRLVCTPGTSGLPQNSLRISAMPEPPVPQVSRPSPGKNAFHFRLSSTPTHVADDGRRAGIICSNGNGATPRQWSHCLAPLISTEDRPFDRTSPSVYSAATGYPRLHAQTGEAKFSKVSFEAEPSRSSISLGH